ncbi:MAG TPA: peptidoglycan-binding domain-containing protein [Stellaceae bacterium]|nr:peptidoglycan-binding domain-containing protein [Stellaceae bacterium]
MQKLNQILLSAVMAGALALPGVALAQGTAGAGNAGSGNQATHKTANPNQNLPSQRYAVTRSVGQGAILTISSSGVREVQQALNRLGYSAGPLSGNWDQPTIRAMQAFQAAHGLEPTGNLDIASIAALGLWQNLIGNPTGHGHNNMIGQNLTGAPAPRGNETGSTGSSGAGAANGGSGGGGR